MINEENILLSCFVANFVVSGLLLFFALYRRKNMRMATAFSLPTGAILGFILATGCALFSLKQAGFTNILMGLWFFFLLTTIFGLYFAGLVLALWRNFDYQSYERLMVKRDLPPTDDDD
ncbi:MAG: hypothetical protein ACRC8S_23230 [Fimbriiglobus sp.]